MALMAARCPGCGKTRVTVQVTRGPKGPGGYGQVRKRVIRRHGCPGDMTEARRAEEVRYR